MKETMTQSEFSSNSRRGIVPIALRALTAILLTVLALSSVQLASAQKKTREERREEANSRAVHGSITDANDAPAVGAVVQLKDMRSLQIRSFITQDDGMYHFSGLKSDVDYQISARSGESSSPVRTLSIFDSRKDAVLNLKLDKK
jgi:hypothetical protein